MNVLLLAVPVYFVLTSSRRHETYEAILWCLTREARRKGVELNTPSIVCDFERAFINAVGNEVCDFLVFHIEHKRIFIHLCFFDLVAKNKYYRMLVSLLPSL